MPNRIFRRLRLLVVILIIIFGLFIIGSLVALLLTPLYTTFNVALHTERIEYVNSSYPISRIPLLEADLWIGMDSITEDFNGSFEIAPDTRVIVERVSRGPLVVRVEKLEEKGFAGTFYNWSDDPVFQAPESTEILITGLEARADSGMNTLIPIWGQVEPGRDMTILETGATSVMYSGEVRMLGRSLTGQVFEADRAELGLGDRFVVQKPQSQALGFVVVNEKAGLQAAYRIVGRKGYITRPGPSDERGYPVFAPFINRLIKDPVFQPISFILGSLMVILGIGTFILDYMNYRNPKQ